MSQGKTQLERKVKLWFQNFQKTEDISEFANKLLPIAVASTQEEFWAYYQHLRRPSHIGEHHNLYVFHDGSTPLWQHQSNKTGGALILFFDKSKSDRIWEDILLFFLTLESKDSKFINGIRLKIGKVAASIEVWVSIQQTHIAEYEHIREWFLEAAQLKDDTHVDFVSFY